MNNTRIKSFIAFLIFLIIYFPFNLYAGPDGGCDPLDPLCPIDGGVSFLIAAGIGLGARKALKQHRKTN